MQLIHAANRWQSFITYNLWSYALRMKNESMNNAPSFQDPQILPPHQLFTRTEVNANPKHWIPFVCPEFALETGYETS